jgi:hypothetical protein
VRDLGDRKRESDPAATAAAPSAANAHGFWKQGWRVSRGVVWKELPARKPRVF